MGYFAGYPSAGGLSACRKEDNVLSLQSQSALGADTPAGMMAADPAPRSEALLKMIVATLTDDKAEDLVQIDLRGKSSIGDFMVICSGRSTRQVSAMAQKLVDKLKSEQGRLSRVEGKDTGDWVLIDTGDVIVHVFRPEVREFYQLEKMWQPIGEPTN
ncbi:MAG: ribosome silencing factor [Rhodobacteraceae bacterium]|nr:ribosome silencing factor [Paracoccaceae bacterium]